MQIEKEQERLIDLKFINIMVSAYKVLQSGKEYATPHAFYRIFEQHVSKALEKFTETFQDVIPAGVRDSWIKMFQTNTAIRDFKDDSGSLAKALAMQPAIQKIEEALVGLKSTEEAGKADKEPETPVLGSKWKSDMNKKKNVASNRGKRVNSRSSQSDKSQKTRRQIEGSEGIKEETLQDKKNLFRKKLEEQSAIISRSQSEKEKSVEGDLDYVEDGARKVVTESFDPSKENKTRSALPGRYHGGKTDRGSTSGANDFRIKTPLTKLRRSMVKPDRNPLRDPVRQPKKKEAPLDPNFHTFNNFNDPADNEGQVLEGPSNPIQSQLKTELKNIEEVDSVSLGPEDPHINLMMNSSQNSRAKKRGRKINPLSNERVNRHIKAEQQPEKKNHNTLPAIGPKKRYFTTNNSKNLDTESGLDSLVFNPYSLGESKDILHRKDSQRRKKPGARGSLKEINRKLIQRRVNQLKASSPVKRARNRYPNREKSYNPNHKFQYRERKDSEWSSNDFYNRSSLGAGGGNSLNLKKTVRSQHFIGKESIFPFDFGLISLCFLWF